MLPDEEIDNEDEVLSDQEQEQSNDVDSETDKDPKAAKGESVRESIRRALKQEQDTETDGETEQKERKTRSKNSGSDEPTSREDETDDTGGEAEEVLNEDEEKPEKKATKSNVPPPGWTKAAKAAWNNLPPEVIESVAKREQEVSDGFREYGEKVKKFEGIEKDYNEINRSFQGREPELQRLGVSKAQVVSQMFQWIDALSHSDRNYARSQLIQLGKNYGIDLSTPTTVTKKEDKEVSTLPPEFQEFASNLDNKFKTIEDKITTDARQRAEQQTRAQQEAANQFVANWAKDKPHFQTVRQAMFGLLQSGSIPLKDGQLDLDEAYNQAVYANPVTREAIKKEAEEAEAKKADAEKREKELKQLRKVNKAKTASSSISTRAPTGGVLKAGERKDGKPPSVRDSIKKSLAELRDQQ